MTRSLFALLLLTASVLPAQTVGSIHLSVYPNGEASEEITPDSAGVEILIGGLTTRWGIVVGHVNVPKATSSSQELLAYIGAVYPYMVRPTSGIPAFVTAEVNEVLAAPGAGAANAVQLCQDFVHTTSLRDWAVEVAPPSGGDTSLWELAPPHWNYGSAPPMIDWAQVGLSNEEPTTILDASKLARHMIAFQVQAWTGVDTDPNSQLVDDIWPRCETTGEPQIHHALVTYSAANPADQLPHPVATPTPNAHPNQVGTSTVVIIRLPGTDPAPPEAVFARFDLDGHGPNPPTNRPWWYLGAATRGLHVQLLDGQSFQTGTVHIRLNTVVSPFYVDIPATLNTSNNLPSGGPFYSIVAPGNATSGISAVWALQGGVPTLLNLQTPVTGVGQIYFQYFHVPQWWDPANPTP